MQDKIETARLAVDEAVVRMQTAAEAIETADKDADMGALESEFDAASGEFEQRKQDLTRFERVAEARAASPVITTDVRVVKEEPTYRPDAPDRRSFFRDMLTMNKSNCACV